jgi:Ras-related GTP-binding protein A/B
MPKIRQDGFVENYLNNQRSHVFGSVAVLIFVFDIESREFMADVASYNNIILALEEFSPNAKVFCLIHTMDLVQTRMRADLFEQRTAVVKEHRSMFADTIEF